MKSAKSMLVHLPRHLWRDDFIRVGGFLVLLNLVGNLLTMLCRMLFGRMLTSEQYGEMDTIVQVIGFAGIPLAASQTAITQYVARAVGEGRPERVAAILWRAARRLSIYCGGILVLVLLCAGLLRHFFHLNSRWPVYAGAATFIGSVFWVVASGGLQGTQRFVPFSLVAIAGAVSRVVFAWLLILPGFGATGALAGMAASNFTMTALGCMLIWPWVRHPREPQLDTAPIYAYLWPTMAALWLGTLSGGIDMIVVKHFYAPETAGHFARAAAIGRLVVFLNGALLAMLLPRVAADAAGGLKTLHLLVKATALSLAIALAGVLFCTLWPAVPIHILHGPGYEFLAPWVVAYAWALVPGSLSMVVTQYLMGRRSFRFLWLQAPATVLYAAALWLWHDTMAHIILIVGMGGLLALGAGTLAVLWEERRAMVREEPS